MDNQTAAPVLAENNAFSQTPRFVVHVGPGLDRFHQLPDAAANGALSSLVYKAHATSMESEQYRWLSEVMVIAPEVRRSEAATVRDIMAQFRAKRQQGGTLLTVVTFSQNVLSAILDAMVHVKFHDEIAVFLHAEDGTFSCHRMTEDGQLENWVYGALCSIMDDGAFRELDFQALSQFKALTK
jgi:hypothetical protein